MIIQCEICKKQFYIRPSHYKRVKSHHCSIKCRGISHRGSGNPKWKNNYKNCLFCNKKFKPKSKDTKFCSNKCDGQFKSKHNSFIGNCVICKKEIHIINAKRNKKITCSRICANKLHRLRMKKDGNSNWRNGIGKLPYGYEFTKELKTIIKKRDNYNCRICGKKVKIIVIHHINYNKQNNKPDNLISLCERCHGKTGYNRKKWTKELSNKLRY